MDALAKYEEAHPDLDTKRLRKEVDLLLQKQAFWLWRVAMRIGMRMKMRTRQALVRGPRV